MRKRIQFEDDIALKRCAHIESKPRFNWSHVLGEGHYDLSGIEDQFRNTEQSINLSNIAEIIGHALTDLLLARKQQDIYNEQNQKFVAQIACEVAKVLSQKSNSHGIHEFSDYDVNLIIEKVLVEKNAHDVALSLVQNRANGIKVENNSQMNHSSKLKVRLIRRSGQVVPWDQNKIEIAVRKAFLFLEMPSDPAVHVAEAVSQSVLQLNQAFINIEDVQDMVQEVLMRMGYFKVAEAYILYRAHRSRLREEQTEIPIEDNRQGSMIMVKTEEGETFLWDGKDLRKRIEFAMIGLDLHLKIDEIESELRRSIYPEMSFEDLKKTIILNARSLIERDADFGKFAGRILLSYIYEEVLGWNILKDGIEKLKQFHRRQFKKYIEYSITIKRLTPGLLNLNLDKLADAIDYSADLDFDYLGIQTLYDRYLIVDKTGQNPRRLETPQFFWMRVAMGLFSKETNPEGWIIKLYNLYKNRRFCSSTPTLFNSGTCRSQLSSCYLYKVDDNLESIMYRGIAENAFLSKWAGGLGGSWTAVRGIGGYIHGTNGESQGVIPFLKVHNDQLVAVNQGGKRRGAGCAYLESWHSDIIDFQELRKNTGDDRRRTHDMNTANWIPDLFMKRMEGRQHWTLFNSGETPDLHELYGKAFEERYHYYEQEAEAGKIYGKKMPAIDLWKKMLGMIFETGHPWITFKDACNVRNPQDHAGVIHSSNLCTEITLNTGVEETAVCNLGSVILENHLDDEGNIDHKKLRETIAIAIRALDNVIDINFYPTKAAETANSRHRPIGLGVMGLQNALYCRGVSFASEEAVEFNDEFMEAIAYYAYEASSDLAAERGSYSSYKGSKWDRGLLPQDTLDLLEKERGLPIDVPRDGKMDWVPLRAKIAKQGMRNSNVLAIAPTATISNIMRTSPCIEPTYKNLFVKSNLSGEFIVLNEFLIRDLKKHQLWNQEMLDQLKYFDGELAAIESIPDDIKAEYLTAFAIPYEYLLKAAARRQKWIDQSQSVNLFLGKPDLKVLSHMYRAAWHYGLKTTYYLRTLGASNIEKATVAIKKEVRGILAHTEAEIKACSLEAMRNGTECEACQ